ncbi:MAG: alpha-amylase [Clostridia bacterium]|nr:alpha-amylase [Clostridia bacterium]
MMKSNKRLMSVLLAAVMASSAALAGCSGGTVNENSTAAPTASEGAGKTGTEGVSIPEDGGFTSVSYTPSTDKYRTFYEIFPYSFYDTDGDGVGDLKGITKKLDYLNDGDSSTTTDLGVEGIWLMPIMPSPSYHKYNITDYKDIDPAYGTMDDFKELVDEAHKRNINVIIDLVLNHTSREHEWYKKAVEELKAGKTDGYAQYYHFAKEAKNSKWGAVPGTDYYYECEFDADMPDLNLTNEKVREEIRDIVKFWIDAGVDGFRLDAVMWFEESGDEGSIEDLKWLYDYAKSVKDDVYMVGECWTDFAIASKYYQSGVDSFFNFDEQGATGDIANAVHKKDAAGYIESVIYYQNKIEEYNPTGINTPFISNHDTGRSAGFLLTETERRMAAALYIIAPGNPFIYYGEEIGMTGSENDPAKRMGMYWSADDTTGYVAKIPGSKNKDLPDAAVDKQLADEDSLLNFYKKVIRLKSQNPEIARGDITAVDLGTDATSGFLSDDNGSKVMVIYNTDGKAATVTIPEDQFKINEVRGYVIADAGDAAGSSGSGTNALDALLGGKTDESSTEESTEATDGGSFSLNGQELTMPAYSVIVLK